MSYCSLLLQRLTHPQSLIQENSSQPRRRSSREVKACMSMTNNSSSPLVLQEITIPPNDADKD